MSVLFPVVGKTGGFMQLSTSMDENSDDYVASQKAIVTYVTAQLSELVDTGRKSFGLLSVPTDVVNGQTVTIGTDVFEVDIINTDSTDDTAGGSWNNTTDPLIIDLTGYTHLDTELEVGALIRVGNEIMKVTAKNGPWHTFARGRCGTTNAVHANAANIYTSDSHPTNLPVGLVTTLTPAAFIAALVAEINAPLGAAAQSGLVTAYDLTTAMLIVAKTVGTAVLATTETLAGADNVWTTGATMVAGRAGGSRQSCSIQYVPTAADVTLGTIVIPLPFTPAFYSADVRVTATGIRQAWNGGCLLGTTPTRLTLTNTGDVDWAATDTIHVFAME